MPLIDGLGSFGAVIAPPPPSSWRFPVAAAALPAAASIDVGPVRDQRKRNSCTGFSMAYAFYALSKVGLIASPLALYWRFREASGFAPSSDNGAFLEAAAKACVKHGVGSEALHPYGPEGADYAKRPSDAYNQQALDHRALAWYRALSVSAVKSAIANGLPVVLGFEVTERFAETGRNGGIWAEGGAVLGGHAVCCFAFSDQTQTLKCRNSWGSAFGDRGDFTVPYSAFPGSRWFDGVVLTAVDTTVGG